jgi:predicted MFS family arabinose efflux permease
MDKSKYKLNLQIFLFTLSRTVVNTSYRMVYPFLPIFARGLGVEPASLAMAFSVRSFLGVFGPFLATVADTRDRKTGMLLGAGLFTLGSALTAIWPGFLMFIIGTSLVLLGNGVFIPSMNAYLGDRISYEKRGRAMAITELSWALAFVGGMPLVRALIENFSWVTPFMLFASVGFILFVILWSVLPAQRIEQSEGNTLWQNLWRVVSYWPALAGLLMGVLFTSANETVNLIFGVWIEDQFGLNFAALTAASVVIGVSELGGEAVTFLWLDKIGKRRLIWLSLLLNSLAALILPFTNRTLLWAMIGLGFFYITFETALVSALTLMSEVVPVARATMMAATVAGFSLGRMMGDLIAPSLYQISFWACALTAAALNVIGIILLQQVKVKPSNAQPS